MNYSTDLDLASLFHSKVKSIFIRTSISAESRGTTLMSSKCSAWSFSIDIEWDGELMGS